MIRVRETYRYITHAKGVRSGRAVVEGTRVGVHDVMGLILTGSSIDDVIAGFPQLTKAHVYECLAYYEDHKGEIDLLVASQMVEQEQ